MYQYSKKDVDCENDTKMKKQIKTKKKVIRKKITLAELKRHKFIRSLNDEYSTCIVEDTKNKKRILIVRKGKCEPNNCKSACCKFINLETSSDKDYFNNFGTKCEGGRRIENICNKLNCKKNTCNIWKTDKFPNACKQFPHPHDRTYWTIFSKCSFYFEKLYEIKDLN